MAAIPTLAFRLGEDSISVFEAAAPRRLAEAVLLLEAKQTLAAIYLMGYVAEIRMKAARYRILGFPPRREITPDIRKLTLKEAAGLPLKGIPHDLEDEALLLISARKKHGIGYPAELRRQITFHASALNVRWRPAIRYRITVPLTEEAIIVREAAEWFDGNYPKLWS